MKRTLIAGFVLLLLGACVEAQQGGTLSGVVTDSRKMGIPGVRVRVIQEKPFAVLYAKTDSRGRFKLENLAPGHYRIRLLDWHDEGGESQFTVVPGVTVRRNFVFPGMFGDL